MLIAPASTPTRRDADTLPVAGEIGDELTALFVSDHRADRQFDRRVIAVMAGAIRSHAMLAAIALPLAQMLQMVERIEAAGCHDPHGAAHSAVAAGGPTLGDELLPPEGDASVAAVAGFDPDRRLVDEHHFVVRSASVAPIEKAACQAASPALPLADAGYSVAAGVTLTKRPREPLSWNCTTPAILAKSVWSRPMPTFVPG